MKKFLIGLVVVGALAAASFAAAAQLNINDSVLQEGATTNLSCQSAPVNLSWTVDGNGNATAVKVSNIDASCNTANALLTGVVVGSSTIPLSFCPIPAPVAPATTSTCNLTLQTAISASGISAVRLWMNN